MEITSGNWSRHLKTKSHLKNDPDQTIKPGKPKISNIPTRLCSKCGLEITSTHWARHLKSQKHLQNNPKKYQKSLLNLEKHTKFLILVNDYLMEHLIFVRLSE